MVQGWVDPLRVSAGHGPAWIWLAPRSPNTGKCPSWPDFRGERNHPRETANRTGAPHRPDPRIQSGGIGESVDLGFSWPIYSRHHRLESI